MFLPIGRTATEASSLRSLFEPNLRLQKSLQEFIASFRAEIVNGATLYSPKLVHEQAVLWIRDYSTKILELTTDAVRADIKSIDIQARPYFRHQDPDPAAPRLPSIRELDEIDAAF